MTHRRRSVDPGVPNVNRYSSPVFPREPYGGDGVLPSDLSTLLLGHSITSLGIRSFKTKNLFYPLVLGLVPGSLVFMYSPPTSTGPFWNLNPSLPEIMSGG